MDIQKVLSKLEPLIPKRAQHWRWLLDTVDAETKDLLQKQIFQTAYRLLGDFRKKILLSLPTEKKAKGTFELGKVIYGNNSCPLGLSQKELLQNLAIFGRSGAGKTNIAFHLLEQAVSKRIPFLFLDYKRTARHLIPKLNKKLHIYTPGRSLSPFPFNPFIIPPGLEMSVYVNHLVDVLSEAYTLGDGARSILQKALLSCYSKHNETPLAGDVLKAIDDMSTTARATGWKMSAKRALESLVLSKASSLDREAQCEFAKTLLNQHTVVELDSLSFSCRKFIVPLLCFWLYCVRLASEDREKLNLLIFLEEAHHSVYRQEQRSHESLMNQLLRQGRELGIGFVVIDQHPHLISSAALGNCYTTICLNQKDPTDINKAAGLCMVDSEDKWYFSNLPVGQGIIKLQDRWREPCLVQFPLMDIQKGIITDDILKKVFQEGISLSELRDRVCQITNDKQRSRLSDKGLEEGGLILLHDVLQYPDDGVNERYTRLGFSADKGNRFKLQLLEHGLATSERIKIGRTHRVVLKPTDKAINIIGLGKDKTYGSLVHEYWKHFYANLFRQRGFIVEEEASRKNGRVDVLAKNKNDSLTIAIEIETGKSDFVKNVKHNLLSKFKKIIVVATDEAALDKIERQLASAGLILPGRMQIVLRDEYRFCGK